jgi:type II secretory pathway component GspD/PulD (secretin)
VLAFAILPTVLGAAPDDELRVIPLKHRPAQEILAQIKPLLSPQDAASAIDYRLIVRAPAKRVTEIEKLVAQLDTPQRNLSLTVKHLRAADAERFMQQVSGEVKVGEHGRVITTPAAGNGAGGVRVEGSGGTARYDTKKETRATRGERTHHLRVVEGKPAFIQVGTSVPVIQKIFSYDRNSVAVAKGVEFHNVTSGFEVVARLNQTQALLTLTPKLASLADPAIGLSNFQELSTHIHAKLGEWVDLGAVMNQRDAVSHTILSQDTDTASDRWTILVKVEETKSGGVAPATVTTGTKR